MSGYVKKKNGYLAHDDRGSIFASRTMVHISRQTSVTSGRERLQVEIILEMGKTTRNYCRVVRREGGKICFPGPSSSILLSPQRLLGPGPCLAYILGKHQHSVSPKPSGRTCTQCRKGVSAWSRRSQNYYRVNLRHVPHSTLRGAIAIFRLISVGSRPNPFTLFVDSNPGCQTLDRCIDTRRDRRNCYKMFGGKMIHFQTRFRRLARAFKTV